MIKKRLLKKKIVGGSADATTKRKLNGNVTSQKKKAKIDNVSLVRSLEDETLKLSVDNLEDVKTLVEIIAKINIYLKVSHDV